MPVTHLSEKKSYDKKSKVVIKFSASWCGPCKKIAPVYDKLSEEHKNITFYEVDVDENEVLAEEFKISAMPTFVSLNKGEEFSRLAGADSKKLESMLQSLSDV